MSAIVAIALLVLGGLSLVLLDALIRRPVTGLWLVLALAVFDIYFDDPLTSAQIMGFRVSLSDIGFAILGVAALLRIVRLSRTSLEQRALLVFGGMAFLSLGLGLGTSAIRDVVNEFRGFVGFLTSALYFATVLPDVRTRLRMMGAWFTAGVAMATIVLLRWTGRVAGAEIGVLDRTYDAAIRVLSGPDTLFLGTIALVLLLPALDPDSNRPRRERVLGALLLAMTVVLNRRTVWLALVAVMLALLILDRRVGKRMVIAAAAGVVLFVAALPLFSTDQYDDSVAQSATSTATLAWRLEGWAALLESGPDELSDYVLGQPFGSSYIRVVAGRELSSNPHSFYLNAYLRMGIIGLAGLIAVLTLTFAALVRSRRTGGPLSSIHLLVLLIMQAVWYVTWVPGPDQGIILGLAVATAAFHRHSTAGNTRPISVSHRRLRVPNSTD